MTQDTNLSRAKWVIGGTSSVGVVGLLFALAVGAVSFVLLFGVGLMWLAYAWRHVGQEENMPSDPHHT